MRLAVRADAPAKQLLLDLQQIVRRAEPDAVFEIATVRELLGESLARERFTTSLLATFAALALILAAVGLYGVLSRAVTARTPEIGLRMALGADAPRIVALVMRTGLLATSAGLIAGALLAGLGLKLLRSEVFGFADPRPSAYVVAAAVLLAVSVLAMFLPARRAARLDPLRAISED